MSAVIVSFGGHKAQPKPWQNNELAELYRAVDILVRAGLAIETDMGVSDEGEPWFVFCRADTGDVIVHCARIDGQFAVSSIAMTETLRGTNFRKVIDTIVRHQPLSLPVRPSGSQLFLHPAVIFTAFVATALLFSQKADAHDLKSAIQVALHDHAPASGGKGLAALKAAITDLLTAVSPGTHSAPSNPLGTVTGTADALASFTNTAFAMVLPAALLVIEQNPAELFSLPDDSPAAATLVQASSFMPMLPAAQESVALFSEPSDSGAPAAVPPSGTLQALPDGGVTLTKLNASVGDSQGNTVQSFIANPVHNAGTEPELFQAQHPSHVTPFSTAPAQNGATELASFVNLQRILPDAHQAAELATITPDAMSIFFGASTAGAWQEATALAGQVAAAAATLGFAVTPDVQNFDAATAQTKTVSHAAVVPVVAAPADVPADVPQAPVIHAVAAVAPEAVVIAAPAVAPEAAVIAAPAVAPVVAAIAEAVPIAAAVAEPAPVIVAAAAAPAAAVAEPAPVIVAAEAAPVPAAVTETPPVAVDTTVAPEATPAVQPAAVSAPILFNDPSISAAATVSAQTAVPTTIIIGADPTAALGQMLNYALGSHPITTALTLSSSLTTALNAYAQEVTGPVHLVVFDSQSVTMPFFAFVQGVLFVNDHQLGLTAAQIAAAPAVTTVDLLNGGTMTLLGVVDSTHFGIA